MCPECSPGPADKIAGCIFDSCHYLPRCTDMLRASVRHDSRRAYPISRYGLVRSQSGKSNDITFEELRCITYDMRTLRTVEMLSALMPS